MLAIPHEYVQDFGGRYLLRCVTSSIIPPHRGWRGLAVGVGEAVRTHASCCAPGPLDTHAVGSTCQPGTRVLTGGARVDQT